MADQDPITATADASPEPEVAAAAADDLDDDDDGIDDLEFLVDDIEDQIAPLAR